MGSAFWWAATSNQGRPDVYLSLSAWVGTKRALSMGRASSFPRGHLQSPTHASKLFHLPARVILRVIAPNCLLNTRAFKTRPFYQQ